MMVGTGGTSVDGVRPLELPGPAIPAENYGAWGCILIRWGNLDYSLLLFGPVIAESVRISTVFGFAREP
ncbi:uncharacterized protein N7469_005750 [Penicillium citrinum]|uniref:Uncharacterized protein n=2 Tax=Penicillium TaxID=5073 RepID=A0A9W9P266_PENCI|nr:uncharacterized protein N7469_005750 [Penicillium citrinum]KAJ5233984.1 hypothetical protein N7469_005750 [Penicillium citrinum]KAJ5572533.1 hypothetical protein N7450_009517 [Penicillium hetheringtonii]